MNTTQLKRLPTYSTLSRIIKENYLYIDKTSHAYRLITQGSHYFLARPRRFGKSLFLSTLEEVLRGNKELFKDLWIGSSDYSWEQYAVVKLDFSTLSNFTPESFTASFLDELSIIAKSYNCPLPEQKNTVNDQAKALFAHLSKNYAKIAVLVDEYDHPILHSLNDMTKAAALREIIQSFFSTLKGSDRAVNFVFITGVSSFTKAGIFSGINNLEVLSLNDHYASLCGYTDDEIERYLHEHIEEWAQQEDWSYQEVRDNLRTWYNGYSFGIKVPKVYNPFSILNAIKNHHFDNYWFSSGTPTFLVELLKQEKHIINLHNLETTQRTLQTFDINSIPLPALLFQAGYLTIKNYDAASEKYFLDYPNREVKVSLQQDLLEAFAHLPTTTAGDAIAQLADALLNNNLTKAVDALSILFAHVPYTLKDPKEKYYHALLQMALIEARIDAQSDYLSDAGRIDLVIEVPNYIYIVEVKFNSQPEVALKQIHERRYYDRFLDKGKQTILWGLSFNRKPKKFSITHICENVTP